MTGVQARPVRARTHGLRAGPGRLVGADGRLEPVVLSCATRPQGSSSVGVPMGSRTMPGATDDARGHRRRQGSPTTRTLETA